MNKTNVIRIFSPMEEFLIDFCDESSKSRHYLYDLKLRDYFQEHPLTKENCKKIKALLKKRRKDYDVICAHYGIETNKISCEDYAARSSRKKCKAELLFRQTLKWGINEEFTQKLYYMAIQPNHLRQYIFEAQVELCNMMKAYDELTGKNTTEGHHVGTCGYHLGRDLLRDGFDTLEEVQENQSCKEVPCGVDTGMLFSDVYSVSKVLDKYGLDNTFWRGSLKLISGTPPFTKDPEIFAIEDYGEVKIYFSRKKINVDVESMQVVLNGCVFSGYCSGYDISLILQGNIWVYFNPADDAVSARRCVIEKVVKELRRVALDIEEDDYDDEE